MAPLRRLVPFPIVLGLWVGAAGNVHADPYQGVTAGSATEPPHASALKGAGARLMTWPGFQMRPDGSSRVFVQTTVEPKFETKKSPGRFELILKNTKVFLRNNRRPLETRFFNTPVTQVQLKRRGKDLAVIVSLRADVTPHVHAEAGPDKRFYYVLMDFPAGQWVEGATAPATSEAPPPSPPPSSAGSQAPDQEKPPPVK